MATGRAVSRKRFNLIFSLVVQRGQAATRGHRQPRQGLSSLSHSLPVFSCSLLTGKHSCSFPELLGKGIGQLESRKERKGLDFCKGWECFAVSGSFGAMSAGIAVRNFPVTLAPKLLKYEKTSCALFPTFFTRDFLPFFPSEINQTLSRVSMSSCTSSNLPCTYLPPQRICQAVLGQNEELQRDVSSKICFYRCV